jgi:anti-sigma-K factor RskA
LELNEIISSGLLELYATGLASKEEALQVEQWIKQYPEVAAEFAEIESATEAYARAHAVQPDETVKEELFSRLNTHKQAPVIPLKTNTYKTTGIPSYWKWAIAASVILLIGSIVLNVSLYNKYDEADKNLQQTQQQLADATESNSEMKQDMNVVQSKYSEPVALHGMNVAPDAAAKIFWMKNTGDVYVDPSNLPDIPEGKQFQLWAIVDGKPVDGGMILTSKKGDKYRIQKMKSFGAAQAFAITIEKAGGSPAPTMDQMVVMGKM